MQLNSNLINIQIPKEQSVFNYILLEITFKINAKYSEDYSLIFSD